MKIIKSSLLIASLAISNLSANNVIATVNGKNITKSDADIFLKASSSPDTFDSVPIEHKSLIIDRLIERILFIEAAKKDGVDKTPLYTENLEKLKDELLINLWMKEQMANAIVSNSEAKDFYDKNKKKFINPAKAKARHILVKSEDEANAIIKELSPLKGDKLKAKFIELAKSKSIGPSGKNGGDLGEFTAEQMVPEFSKATFALKDGEITKKAVKTQFGYHIIYLESLTPESSMDFDSVKESIVNSLRQQQFTKKLTEVANELRNKSKITIIDLNSTK
ncbi:Peptidyl-prolyl cis-trans isomerase PpiC [hydrothermal vent metagenome]|uniref:Peptidyl-prolyl cis-trans isomerase PpiC n=1 Tax=hydrothermal vent metagenome TaxID=652676 RepID=A0A1W1ELA5_9ZZZZ